MIIVVQEHDNGWFSHVAVTEPRVVLSDLLGSMWEGWKTHSRDQEVFEGDHINQCRIRFERYDDPIEDRLLRELDVSMAVYADWLEERGRAPQAEMLRLQLAALEIDPSSPEFAAIDERLNDLVAELPYGWRCHTTRPIAIIGDELTFRIGRHQREAPQMRLTQIWAGGHHQTQQDDTIYVPQFKYSLERERDTLVRGETFAETLGLADRGRQPPSFTLFNHGATTDSMSCVALIDGEDLVLDFREITIRMPTRAYVELLGRVIALL